MDNKRVYKKISTIFWFILATLPVLLATFGYILSFFIHFDGVTNATDIKDFYGARTWSYFMDLNISGFVPWIPLFIKDMFRNLFLNLSSSNGGWVASVLSWFVWVYFIELMVDFVVWLPRMCHSWMERWCKD